MIRRLWRWLVRPRPMDWPSGMPREAPAGSHRVTFVNGRCECCYLWALYCICGWPYCKGGHQ